MSWTEHEGFAKMIFESDAQTVVKAIEGINNDISEFGDIIEGCEPSCVVIQIIL
ncbi:hypothetical protein LINPERHAP1_LOCUS32478 [Linum perenne]